MAFPTGWSYYAPITISNGSADYQTKVTVHEGSGTNGANVVYCAGHCQADFDDLRFTGSDFVTLLDYWIESVTGVTPNQVAIVQVQNNATPSTTGRMYYGNPDATAQFATPLLAGEATFIFFDDFSGTTLNTTTKWTVSSGTPTVASGICTLKREGTNEIIRTQATFATNTATRTSIKSVHFNSASYEEWTGWHDGSTEWILSGFCHSAVFIRAKHVTAHTTWGSGETMDGWSAGVYGIIDQMRRDTTSVIFRVNNANEKTVTTYNPVGNLFLYVGAVGVDTSEVNLDWVLIRKYAFTEPSFAFGSEITIENRRRSAFFPFM